MEVAVLAVLEGVLDEVEEGGSDSDSGGRNEGRMEGWVECTINRPAGVPNPVN